MLVHCNFLGWCEVLMILLKSLSAICIENSMHISLNTLKMTGEITARLAIVKVGPSSREGEITYIELKQMYVIIIIKNTLLITLFCHFSAVKL